MTKPALRKEFSENISTHLGRIKFTCDSLGIAIPALEFDKDDPSSPLMTDEFLDWMLMQGISIDWIVSGDLKSMLFDFRYRHQVTAEKKRFLEIFGRFDETEQRLFLAGLELIAMSNADVDSVMQGVSEQIHVHRRKLASPE